MFQLFKAQSFLINPNKASSKIIINTTLMSLTLTLFTIIWTLSPNRIISVLLIQFVLAIPLFYVSCIAYTKIAYRKEVHHWNHLGWFTGTAASAMVLNIFGILIAMLGQTALTIVYFLFLWSLMILYTIINSSKHSLQQRKVAYFKLAYFVGVQIVFGIGIFFL